MIQGDQILPYFLHHPRGEGAVVDGAHGAHRHRDHREPRQVDGRPDHQAAEVPHRPERDQHHEPANGVNPHYADRREVPNKETF